MGEDSGGEGQVRSIILSKEAIQARKVKRLLDEKEMEALRLEFPHYGRRKLYKIKMYRDGRCVNCGELRRESPFKRVCLECGKARTKQKRKYTGSKVWKEGTPGRRPSWAKGRRTGL